ncbi:MAG: hypothetical protein IPJ58_09520 [Ardenticatenia bacterium]|nr:hypothetical protein [Ardenticatenia bacterium]
MIMGLTFPPAAVGCGTGSSGAAGDAGSLRSATIRAAATATVTSTASSGRFSMRGV